jgi:thiamine pyrophosphokinase
VLSAAIEAGVAIERHP